MSDLNGGSFAFTMTLPFQIVRPVRLRPLNRAQRRHRVYRMPRHSLHQFNGWEILQGHIYGWTRSARVVKMRRQYRGGKR